MRGEGETRLWVGAATDEDRPDLGSARSCLGHCKKEGGVWASPLLPCARPLNRGAAGAASICPCAEVTALVESYSSFLPLVWFLYFSFL